MPVPVLTDDDILPLLDMREMVPLMEGFVRARADGGAVTPPRHAVSFGALGQLVFTIGGLRNADRSLAGFRVYDTFKAGRPAKDAQIVAVWDSESGALLGLLLGELIGAWRTGALGGVAVKHMSRPDARLCAVIGSGRQARTQLLATAACRNLSEVRVYGRDMERKRRFVAELSRCTGLNIRGTNSAREAVEGADIVLCATSSDTPVLEAAWLAPGAHVNTVGPKTVGAHELPTEIADRVTLVATDSIEQVSAYSEPHFLSGSAAWTRLVDLAALVALNADPPRARDGISLFCSAGLAGTEILAAARVLERHRQAHP